MRKIKVITLDGVVRALPLVSSVRDIEERNIAFKGLFADRPGKISTCTLSSVENSKFERGEIARVKGGLYKVKRYSPDRPR